MSESRSPVRQVAIGAEEQGQRLDKLVGRLLPGVPRSRVFRLIRRGEVRVNGRRASPEQRLAAGDRLRLPPVLLLPGQRSDAPQADAAASGTAGERAPQLPASLLRRVEASILHADERLLVLDKPAGIAVHGGSGLSFGIIEALRASRPDETLELVHRLDRDTSGLLMVARRRSALRILHALLREGAVRKSYLTLVAGRWRADRQHIDAPLRTDLRVGGERTVRVDARQGKAAVTEFRVLERYGDSASLIEVVLHTGRTHQIRVHAAHAGHPVVGDEKYGDAEANARLRALGLRRMFLHAHSCSFTWPESGVEQSFNAPLPADLRQVLDQLVAQRPAGRARARRT